MRRRIALLVASLAVATGLATQAHANETGGAPRCVGASPTLAAAYNEAFRQPLGNWQAGDVLHSYPLPDGSILWLLNDSFLNAKDPSSGITKDSTFIRNVAVKQIGRCFEIVAGPMSYPGVTTTTTTTTTPIDPTSTTSTTLPQPASFLSQFELKDQAWWWFHGGDVDGDYLHVFATAMHQTGRPNWGIAFEPAQVFIATYNWHSLELVDLRAAPNDGVHPGYGFSVANDETYTYLYGNTDNLQLTKADRHNYVARVPLHQVFATPTYWNGSTWVYDPAAAVSISTEGTWNHRMSVMHQDDRWIATAKADDFFGNDFLILEAPEPQGPWVITQRLAVGALGSPGDGVTYDGLAIPRVIDGKIIVNWSNNQYDFAHVAPQPRLYRPSFADVALGAPTQSNDICHGLQPGGSGTLQAGATSRFEAIAPTRVLDTRAVGGPLAAGETRRLDLAAALHLSPGQASAAVLNVTMDGARTPGYVTVWPGGRAQPEASNLNADRAGATAADLVTTPIGADGSIQIFSSTGTQIIVDVAGLYVPATTATSGRFVPLSPARILDSRSGRILSARATTSVATLGQGGLPASGVSAVVLNLTSTGATGGGYVTAWGDGARPTASNLNIDRGMTRANQVIVPVGADGAIRLYNDAPMHLIVDVSGYYTNSDAAEGTAGLFVPVVPMRLMDSRRAAGIPGVGCEATVVIPANATAAVTTITLVDSHRAGYATVWPGGQPRPGTSTLNLDAPNQTRPNHAIVGLDGSRSMQIYLEPRAHTLVDLAGYFT